MQEKKNPEEENSRLAIQIFLVIENDNDTRESLNTCSDMPYKKV